MATPEATKAQLLARLTQIDQQAASLMRLRRQIEDAVSEVTATIAGAASGEDRKVLDELRLNLDQLDRSIRLMRSAVVQGRRFAASV
jgi:predicted  nucleic acid-binding Zn-ribbon protein